MRRIAARDVALVGGAQVLAILGAVLAARRWEVRFVDSRLAVPFAVTCLVDYGVLLLAIPFIWTGSVLWANSRVNGGIRQRFLVGLLLALAFSLVFGYSVGGPWVKYNGTINRMLSDGHHIS